MCYCNTAARSRNSTCSHNHNRTFRRKLPEIQQPGAGLNRWELSYYSLCSFLHSQPSNSASRILLTVLDTQKIQHRRFIRINVLLDGYICALLSLLFFRLVYFQALVTSQAFTLPLSTNRYLYTIRKLLAATNYTWKTWKT